MTEAIGAGAGSFWSKLKPASYRGVKFVVEGANARFGRRNAVHEYPYRDTPWVEDMGRQSRRIMVSGWIVGDDVIEQRERLIKVCEQPGDGELVHPTLGRLKVALMEFSTGESKERGRVFEVHFVFLEQGDRLFPGDQVNSAGAVSNAAEEVTTAAGDRFVSGAKGLLQQYLPVDVAAAVDTWTDAATKAVNNATSLLHSTETLQGNFGRFIGAELIGTKAASSIAALISSGATFRQKVGASVAALIGAGLNLTSPTLAGFVKAALSLPEAVLSASAKPSDGVQSLLDLSKVQASSTGAPQLAADLFRRAAVATLAKAAAAYQPGTVEEATEVRGKVLGAIDAEIDAAGDQGDDAVYTALRALRAEVIRDLNAKGASLPNLVTVATNVPMPSLALAQRLYRDADRDTELVRGANPRHPAFMPTTFKAVSE